MIAEGIKEKLNTNGEVRFTRMERAYLMTLMSRVISHDKANATYYRINESMTNRRNRWTLDDIEYLKDAYNRGETDKEIADALARSLKGIERKRYALGLKKGE